jgi:hypothetical protein
MENTTFDRIIARLDAGTPRRRLLAGLLGTTAAVLTGAAGSDARKTKQKGRKHHIGYSAGGGAEKVQICRRNRRRKSYSLIAVARRAVPAHRRRGSIICPVPPECFVITGCSGNGSSVCAIEPDEGAPCNDFYPAAGVCNAEGECTELPLTWG